MQEDFKKKWERKGGSNGAYLPLETDLSQQCESEEIVSLLWTFISPF